MNLHPAHRKLLHSPSPEDKSFAMEALPRLRSHQKLDIRAATLCCMISLLLTIVSSKTEYSSWPIWLFLAASQCLTASFIIDYHCAERMSRAIRSGEYNVLHGICRKSVNDSLPIAERFEVHGTFLGPEVPFIFGVDFSVIKALPESGWEFSVLANDRRAVVLIPGPQNEIFLSTNITKYYPYREED